MVESELKYPAGEQNFPNIREEKKVYIDKTGFVYNLVNNNKYLFLARPRRFGKSLLLSTIQAYFEGRRDLFEGLEIMNLEKEWRKYPVLNLELSRISTESTDSLKAGLNQQFSLWEEVLGIVNTNLDFASRFSTIIIESYKKTGERVVILIDEYDNPLINTLHKQEIHEANRELLKSIYSNLKALDGYIKFAMLTGVSRFSKMSIFSGLNNLTDITFDNRYAEICGFTVEEIRKFLWPGVEKMAEKMGCSAEEALGKLKEYYDGYHFTSECRDLYNPYSLLRALDKSSIEDFWFNTGTPSFLIEKLKASKTPFLKLFNSYSREISLANPDMAFSSPIALMFQTGYLTIKEYNAESRRYKLGIPNLEVEQALFDHLLAAESGYDGFESTELLWDMKDALREGRTEDFMKQLRSFLAGIPANINPMKMTELNFENTLYVLLKALGFEVNAEEWTSSGRIDLLIKTKGFIYVMELKFDGTAEEALKQIEEKGYTLPYESDGRKIYKIGVNFSSQTRTVSDWLIE